MRRSTFDRGRRGLGRTQRELGPRGALPRPPILGLTSALGAHTLNSSGTSSVERDMKPFAAAVVLCAIAVTASVKTGAQSPVAGPTYSRDVAPILYKNCTTCHRPGEIGPMSLLTYKD